jgi:poly-gamma-glutamate capsule biosynthesis protein CapA/YwtB (metallophosphatase superfamily)
VRPIALAALALAVGPAGAAPAAAPAPRPITLLFTGDVMLGRGVAPLVRSDPAAVFGGVRFELSSADLAVANLESPLTTRAHLASHGPNALEARPGSARLLAAAGFDAIAIANNHAGDAGPHTVPDTIGALAAAGIPVLGAGATLAAAFTPRILVSHGVRVALLSFDDTGEGPRAGPSSPGVAWWDPARARRAVERARAEADVVVVGIQGGSDYDPTTDPWLMHLGRLLARWGADIVWGTGPHVVQPTRTVVSPGGRVTIVATSLGNLLFDQHIPGTRTGELLEVLAGSGGVRAYRLGTTAQEPSNAVDFGHWKLPAGDAAALGAEWWTIAGAVTAARPAPVPSLRGFPGRVAAAAVGDVEGNGGTELAVSFWRPYRSTDVNALIPRRLLVDRRGLTAHLGIYRPAGRAEIWVAGTLLRPIRRLAACAGAIAVGYSTLDGGTVVGTGAWRWTGFGFTPLADLPGAGVPGCADVDGDGRLDPVILGRSRR